jgi:hypothetical protein
MVTTNMTKEKMDKEIEQAVENFYKNRPPNGCSCPTCMHGWKMSKKFDKIEDKDAYYKERKESYVVDDLVFDTSRDITDGDKLFWSDNEHKLCEVYRDKFGMMSYYSVMLNYEHMGLDVEYQPKTSKEERVNNFDVDAEFVLLNAMSDNPRVEDMTDGEVGIYERVRKRDYLTPKEREESIECHKQWTRNMFVEL